MNLMHPDRIMGTFNACRTLTPREVEELERLGIPPDALAGPIPVVSSTVNFDGDRFEFEHHHHRYADKGARAFIFLITNQWDEAIDIVAWSPSAEKLATWLGRGWALGQEKVYAPRLIDHAGIQVHRSLAGWLQAYRDGICLIRPQAAAHYLDDAGPLLAEDEEHGEELDRVLTRPKPRILIPSSHFERFRKVS
ncbi:hypothetical protein [Microvirga zambiensis]|uniref:hypothetical protein n=1 Tax=Microvirga zambiensis TaxID=1402137 RepID=UPI00191F8C02|nr:hypothetical protein [Microvirga zambiensis]